jgi:hypothetical protein
VTIAKETKTVAVTIAKVVKIHAEVIAKVVKIQAEVMERPPNKMMMMLMTKNFMISIVKYNRI